MVTEWERLEFDRLVQDMVAAGRWRAPVKSVSEWRRWVGYATIYGGRVGGSMDDAVRAEVSDG